MADDDFTKGTTFVGDHSVYSRRTLDIAPTDGSSKFNTISIPLIPVACWRLNAPGFAFDSSFVAPAFRDEVGDLRSHLQRYKGCPAAIFGHTDPAGSDTLNKTLGDRRAIAVYALLTRQPDLWAYLHDQPEVGDTWDLHMVQTMLASIPDAEGNPYLAGPATGTHDALTDDAVRRFQTDAGLKSDGDPGSQTRKALYGAYMDWLCSLPGSSSASQASSDGSPLPMQPTDFLGGAGAQPGDLPKMSLQSCGKFNPIVLLTADEMGGVDTSNEPDGASKIQRNADDAPNRRVVMFLFEKGTTVDTGVWPCPKVTKPNAACKSAFWPDGDGRRKNGDTLRLYEKTRDTMACRFYDRFARRSPCEGKRQVPLKVTLYFAIEDDPQLLIHDGSGTLVETRRKETARTDEQGIITFSLEPTQLPNPVLLKLGTSYATFPHGQAFDPVALRNVLAAGDVQSASALFFDGAASSASGGSAPSTTTTTALKVTLTYDSPSHRYVSRLRSTSGGSYLKFFEGTSQDDMQRVSEDQFAVDKGGHTGTHRFTIKPESTRVHVFARIVDDDNNLIMSVDQLFAVRRTATDVDLVPQDGAREGAPALHPRLTLPGVHVDKKTGLLPIRMDTLFLDVTETTGVAQRLERVLDAPFRHVPQRCRYSVVEYTRSDSSGNAAWAIVEPPAIDRSTITDVKFVLVFQHEFKLSYRNADDAPLFRIDQYFSSPTFLGSFFPEYSTVRGSEGTRDFTPYPSFGMAQALVESGKSAIALFPFPKGEGFGDLSAPKASDLENMLHSLIVCMWGPNVGPRTRRPRMAHLATCGWSSGTATLLNQTWRSSKLVDEMYVFDGRASTKANVQQLGSWITGKRKLRLVGTANTIVECILLKQRFASNDSVSQWPAHLGYWYSDTTYSKAHTPKISFTPTGFQTSGAKPSSSSDDTTNATGIELSTERVVAAMSDSQADYQASGVVLKAQGQTGFVMRLSNVEAACLARYQLRRGSSTPVANAKEFQDVVKSLNESGDSDEKETWAKHRHAWSMIGGSVDGNSFLSYFRQCLDLSDF